MAFDEAALAKDTLTEAEFWDMVDTAYHEARHAKQYWEATRWKASDGTYKSADEMAQRLGLDKEMTGKAWEAKVGAEDPNRAFGERMFKSLFSETTQEVKAELSAAEDFLADKLKELDAMPADAPPGKRKLAEMAAELGRERHRDALKAERALEHEADAYKAAAKVTRSGRAGLAGNPQVRVAEEVVESVRVRVRVAADKVEGLKASSTTDDAMKVAQTEFDVASGELTVAETKLAAARKDYGGGW